MSLFYVYLQLGFDHIIDYQAFDHILFIITLTAVYLLVDWKKVLILITAFTIGHTATLALSTLNILSIDSSLVEFLIPLTIFITAIGNIFENKTDFSSRLHNFKYLTALIFGLIHGLGFSNYLKSLLGMEQSLIKPLFAFNLGLEIGQVIIVLIILIISSIAVGILNIKKREWNLILSGAGLGVSVVLMLERLF
ncbi:MAG: HupE/UreJ family protein [Bacteroidetes bacterium]|nr:MAG: HupE/UreJ family protein [Bacteroidota bacterium]